MSELQLCGHFTFADTRSRSINKKLHFTFISKSGYCFASQTVACAHGHLNLQLHLQSQYLVFRLCDYMRWCFYRIHHADQRTILKRKTRMPTVRRGWQKRAPCPTITANFCAHSCLANSVLLHFERAELFHMKRILYTKRVRLLCWKINKNLSPRETITSQRVHSQRLHMHMYTSFQSHSYRGHKSTLQESLLA